MLDFRRFCRFLLQLYLAERLKATSKGLGWWPSAPNCPYVNVATDKTLDIKEIPSFCARWACVVTSL